MIAFVDDHRSAYGVEPICRELPIAPSTYHAEIARRTDPAKAPPRVRRDVGSSRRDPAGLGRELPASTASARSGGSSAAKASASRAAPWPA